MQEEIEVGGNGELGCAVVAAPFRIPVVFPLGNAVIQQLCIRRAKRVRCSPRFGTFEWRYVDQLGLLHASGELGGIGFDAFGILCACIEHGLQSLQPPLTRKVCTTIHRTSVWQAHRIQRPTAALGHELHCRHVNAVHVRALFAIDLDVDEVFVHECRRRAVLKRFVLHHVAPMAGAVADAHDDQFVFCPRLLPRFFRPRLPIYRVVGVLQEVGAGLMDEGVGVRM